MKELLHSSLRKKISKFFVRLLVKPIIKNRAVKLESRFVESRLKLGPLILIKA